MRPRFIRRYIRQQTAHHAKHRYRVGVGRSGQIRISRGWKPEIRGNELHRANETRWSNARDDDGAAVHTHGLADDGGVRAEAATPECMAQYRLQLTTRAIHARVEEPASEWLHTQGLEIVAADQLRLRHLRTILHREAEGKERPREQHSDVWRRVRESPILAQRKRAWARLRSVSERNHHKLLGLLERERSQQEPVDDSEGSGVRAGCDCQAEDGGGRPPGSGGE